MRVSVICKWGKLRSLAEVEHCCNYFLMFQCYWITIVLPGPLFQIIDPSWTINTQIQVETDIMVSLLLVLFVALRVACIAVGRNSTNAERPAAAFNTGLAPNASLTNGNALFCAPVLTHGSCHSRPVLLRIDRWGSAQRPRRPGAIKEKASLTSCSLNDSYPVRAPFHATASSCRGNPNAKPSTADGTCAIDVFLAPHATSALASEQEVALAGLTLIRTCVRDQSPPQGGIFQLNKDLAVSVSSRFPHVDCYGSVGPSSILESCRSILPTMQRSYNERSFGTQGASIKLPYSLTSGKSQAPYT
jgi:hypothetical protein